MFLGDWCNTTYSKPAGYPELDKALLKLCNMKYAIRSRFSLIVLTRISKA